MLVIYKYELKISLINYLQRIEMPVDAKILAAEFQTSDVGNNVDVWALIDIPEHAPPGVRNFYIAYTGNHIDIDRRRLHYINRLQRHGLVYHVFEVASE